MGGFYNPRRTYTGRDRILDLILRRGDIEAEGAHRSGQVWSGLAGNLAGIGGQAFDEYSGEQAKKDAVKKLAVQDAAATNAILAWDGKDPQTLRKALIRVKGPVEGQKLAESTLSFHAITGKMDDDNIARVKTSGEAAARSTYKVFETLYPGFLTKRKELEALGITLPDAPTPELHEAFKSYFGKPAEPYTLNPGQERRGPNNEVVATGPAETPKPPAVGSFEDYLRQRHGPRPSPEQIESARKAYNQADDKGPDPVARELAALRLVEAKEKAAGTGAPKPLSGEAAKVLSVATTLGPTVNQLKDAFTKDYEGAVRGVISGTDRRLVRLVDDAADKVGRLRSGGAINKDEEARFKRLLGATVMDAMFGKSEDAIAALDAVLAEADQIITNVRPGGRVGPLRRGQPAPRLGRFERVDGAAPSSRLGRFERVD